MSILALKIKFSQHYRYLKIMYKIWEFICNDLILTSTLILADFSQNVSPWPTWNKHVKPKYLFCKTFLASSWYLFDFLKNDLKHIYLTGQISAVLLKMGTYLTRKVAEKGKKINIIKDRSIYL